MSVTLNQAKFGTGVYGTAKYGQFIVDINLGVTATGTVASVEPQVKVSATAVTASLAIASVNVTNRDCESFVLRKDELKNFYN